MTRPGDDRGAASVFVLAVGVVLVTAGVFGAAVGAARVARHEARNAADLGALAGGQRAIEGENVACAEAARYVSANNGRLTSCAVNGLEIVVRVEVTVEPLPGMSRVATAAARAGPVTYAAAGRSEQPGAGIAPGEPVPPQWLRTSPGRRASATSAARRANGVMRGRCNEVAASPPAPFGQNGYLGQYAGGSRLGSTIVYRLRSGSIPVTVTRR